MESVDGKWGNWQSDGSYDGIIGMLSRKEIDIGISGFHLTKNMSDVADFLTLFRIIEYVYSPAVADCTIT